MLGLVCVIVDLTSAMVRKETGKTVKGGRRAMLSHEKTLLIPDEKRHS